MSLGMRLIAKLIIFVYLFQISFNSYASILSNANVQYQLDTNLLFELLANDRDFLYGTSDAVVTTPPPGMDIETFYRAVEDNRSDLLKDKTYIPIISGNITSFIPINILDKTVGPAFVQSRLVRTQVKNLLGRNLINQFASGGIYVNETAQLNTLYGNALDLLKNTNSFLNLNYNLEFGLPLNLDTENSGLEKDIIWPEFRELHGQTVLVPVVYLTKTTYDQFRVDGHTIQFAGNASFDNLNIENSTVRFERDAYLNVAKNLISTSGAIIGNGDLDIVSGGVLHNVSSLITSVNGDLTLLADRIESRTLIHRYDFNGGHSERFGDISGISANGDVTLRAYSDILISGTEVVSENESIRFAADGNIYIVAQSASSESSRRAGGWRVNQRSSVDYLSSTLNAEDAIELIANGNILIDASEIIAGNGHIEILAGLGITVQDELSQYQSYQKGKFGKTKKEISAYKTVAIRSLLDAGKGITIHAEYGDITLKAAEITSIEGTNVRAANGKLNLLSTRENDQYSYNAITKSLFTTRTVNRGYERESVVANTVVGGFNVEALNGLTVEFEGDPDADFNGQLDALQTLPGYEWIASVRENPDIDLVAIESKYREWNEKTTSLSPAALAVISIVVAVVAGPAVAQLYGAAGATAATASAAAIPATSATVLGSTTLGAAAVATTTSLISATVIAQANALVDGRDPLEASFETITSSDTLRSAVVAGITAGAIAALDAEFFNVDSLPDDDFRKAFIKVPTQSGELVDRAVLSLTGQAVQGLTQAAVSAGIQYIDLGGDFSEYYKQSLIQYAIDNVGEYAATQIGLAYDVDNPTSVQTALKYISHAGVGCVLGAASAAQTDEELDAACFAQAGGAVIGEFVGGLIAETGGLNETEEELFKLLEDQRAQAQEYIEKNYTTTEINKLFSDNRAPLISKLMRLRRHGADLAKLSAAIGAFIVGANEFQVNAAARGAYNAAYYNAAGDVIALASIQSLIEYINQAEGPVEQFLNYTIDQVIEWGKNPENQETLEELLSLTLGALGFEDSQAFLGRYNVLDATPEVLAGTAAAILDQVGTAALLADVGLRQYVAKAIAIPFPEQALELVGTNVAVGGRVLSESYEAIINLPTIVASIPDILDKAVIQNDSESQIQVTRVLVGVIIGSAIGSVGVAAIPETFGISGIVAAVGGASLTRSLRVLHALSQAGKVNLDSVLDELPFETHFSNDRLGGTTVEFTPRIETADLQKYRVLVDGVETNILTSYRDQPGHQLLGPRGGVYTHVGRDKEGNLTYISDNNVLISEINGKLIRRDDDFRTGLTGESLVVDDLYKKGGWEQVDKTFNPLRYIDDDLPDYRGARGLDRILTRINANGEREFVILEVKSSLKEMGATGATLSRTTDGASQLSKEYIRNRINNVSMGGLNDIQLEQYEMALLTGRVKYVRANVDMVVPGFNTETSSGFISYRELIHSGELDVEDIGEFNPIGG